MRRPWSTNRTQDTTVIPWPGSDQSRRNAPQVFTDLANEAASAGEVQGFADIGSLGFKAIKIPVAGRQTGPVLARPLEAEADDE